MPTPSPEFVNYDMRQLKGALAITENKLRTDEKILRREWREEARSKTFWRNRRKDIRREIDARLASQPYGSVKALSDDELLKRKKRIEERIHHATGKILTTDDPAWSQRSRMRRGTALTELWHLNNEIARRDLPKPVVFKAHADFSEVIEAAGQIRDLNALRDEILTVLNELDVDLSGVFTKLEERVKALEARDKPIGFAEQGALITAGQIKIGSASKPSVAIEPEMPFLDLVNRQIPNFHAPARFPLLFQAVGEKDGFSCKPVNEGTNHYFVKVYRIPAYNRDAVDKELEELRSLEKITGWAREVRSGTYTIFTRTLPGFFATVGR